MVIVSDPDNRKYWRGIAGSRIVFGGAYMSAVLVDQFLQACPYVDAVVDGEGEEALAALAGGAELAAVPGIMLRDQGFVRRNIAKPSKMVKVAVADYQDLPRHFSIFILWGVRPRIIPRYGWRKPLPPAAAGSVLRNQATIRLTAKRPRSLPGAAVIVTVWFAMAMLVGWLLLSC